MRDNDVLQGVAARFALGLNVSANGQPARANGDLVSGNYFEVLGLKVRFTHTTDRPWTSAGAASRRVSVHDAIVSLQIALALSMLITAALLVQSVRSLKSVDPGFRVDNLLLVSLDAAAAGYDASRIDGFWRAVLDHVGGIRGVQGATLAGTVPLAPGRQRQSASSATRSTATFAATRARCSTGPCSRRVPPMR